MSYMEWDGSIRIGHDLVDDDHRTLMACVNEVHDCAADDQQTIRHVLSILETYTREHFDREEDLMESKRYPDLASHRKEHAILVRLFHQHRDEYLAGTKDRESLLKFLKMWLIGHIKGCDSKFALHLKHLARQAGESGDQYGPIASGSGAVSRSGVDWSRMVIGIIDDTPDQHRIIKAMLRGFGGGQAHEYTSGSMFLKDAANATREYDLLLIDDQMEGLGGVETIRGVRSTEALASHKAVAILMVSDGNMNTIRQGLESGFHGVVAKPFSANAIRQQAERFLMQPLPWQKEGKLWRPLHPKK